MVAIEAMNPLMIRPSVSLGATDGNGEAPAVEVQTASASISELVEAFARPDQAVPVARESEATSWMFFENLYRGVSLTTQHFSTGRIFSALCAPQTQHRYAYEVGVPDSCRYDWRVGRKCSFARLLLRRTTNSSPCRHCEAWVLDFVPIAAIHAMILVSKNVPSQHGLRADDAPKNVPMSRDIA
jgi:hypothetical protein